MPRKSHNPLTADPIKADPTDVVTQVVEGAARPASRPRARRKTAAMPSTTIAGAADVARTEIDVTSVAAEQQANIVPDSPAGAPLATDAVAKPPFTPADGTLKAPKPGTKQALVVDLLSREAGATVTELQGATGWLPHTTRAALTGLRQRGHVLAASKTDGVRRYRILTPRSPAGDNGVSSASDAAAVTEAGQ